MEMGGARIREDNRWTKRLTEWQPRTMKRRRERQKRRWRDDITTYIGTTWARTAQDRGRWQLYLRRATSDSGWRSHEWVSAWYELKPQCFRIKFNGQEIKVKSKTRSGNRSGHSRLCDFKWPQIDIWPHNIGRASQADQHVWVLWPCYVTWTSYSIFWWKWTFDPSDPKWPQNDIWPHNIGRGSQDDEHV